MKKSDNIELNRAFNHYYNFLNIMYGQNMTKYMFEWSNGHILVPLSSVVEERQQRKRETERCWTRDTELPSVASHIKSAF